MLLFYFHVYVSCVCSTHRRQKRAWDPFELVENEVNSVMELRSFGRAAALLTAEQSPGPVFCF